MMQLIKKCFVIMLCLPIIMLCACSKSKPTCKEVSALDYYFENDIKCNLFNNLPDKNITLADITSSKLDKTKLDSYAKLTFTAKSVEIYHMYIEYIYFKLYTNQSSEFEMNVNIEITNAVNESDVHTAEPKDNKYINTYSCIAKENNIATFKVEVKRTIATVTGAQITFDILDSEIYATNPETHFKWCIYDFKIYGESRAYSA